MSSRERYLANLRRELGFSAEQKRSKADCPGVFTAADDDFILDRVKYRTDITRIQQYPADYPASP